MKNLRLFSVLSVLLTVILLSSCTYRLVDFTVISTKNAEMGVNRTKGVATEGQKSYFFGAGFNLKDALDDALENAGPQYDLLIDGIVSYQNVFFVSTVKVKGVAVSTSDLRAVLSPEEFQEWYDSKDVLDPLEFSLGH